MTTNNNLSLKICCKNIVKIVYTYYFLKKKKKKNCGNGISETQNETVLGIGLGYLGAEEVVINGLVQIET